MTLVGAAGPLLWLTTEALARAGGGEGYSGGGGGGGGGGWGGGGGGGGDGGALFELLYWWIIFCFDQPQIGLPVTFVVLVIIYVMLRSARNEQRARTIRRGTAAMDQNERAQALERISASDPDFKLDAFLNRVNVAFGKIQAAWCAQDLATVRPFISDAVHERFTLQLQEQKLLGYRNRMTQIQILDTALADFTSHDRFDMLAVRIEASAIDEKVSLEGDKRLTGGGTPEPFVEIWSFLRRRGARSRPGLNGLIEGHCPNCGVQVEMNQFANCPNCKAVLRSGEYDWVLTEITQDSEWRRPSLETLPGIDAIQQADPDFNLQSLEDRAAVIFYRMAKADRINRIDPLRKMVSPKFAERFAASEFEAMTQVWYGERAVGSVETLGAIPGNDWQRVLVEVRWNGIRFTQERHQPPKRTTQAKFERTLLILGRKTGVKTNLDQSISSAHCPNCGAPETDDASDACPYCHTVLNDGLHGWILLNAMPSNLDDAAQMLSSLRASPGDKPAMRIDPATNIPFGAGAVAWMAQMALADGTVTDDELQMLQTVGARHNITPDMIQRILGAIRGEQLRIPQPSSASQARQWLTAMASAAFADGRIAPSEKALLQSAAERAGFSPYDLRAILNRARNDRYQLARQALREARKRN